MLMNITIEYDDEYEQKTLTLSYYDQKKKGHLSPTLIPTLKLNIQGLRISITEGVCCGIVPTSHLLTGNRRPLKGVYILPFFYEYIVPMVE